MTVNIPRGLRISETGFPDMDLAMLVILDALRGLGRSATIQELVDYIIDQENISEEEQGYLIPSGVTTRLKHRLGWARTVLKRGGAAENSAHGIWALTETGENITRIEQTKEIYDRIYTEDYNRAKAKRDAANADNAAVQDDMPISQEEDAANSLDEISSEEEDAADWRDALLSEILKMDPSAFERLAQRLMREAGFVKVEVRGRSNDGGIDGVGILRVNLISFQVYFQCKRWSNSVGSKEIRDFRGAMEGRAGKGLFITASSFTKQASEEATREGTIAIDLIDGERLCELLKQYELGVKTETVEQVTIQPDWFHKI